MSHFSLSLDVGGSHVTAGLVDADARHVVRAARREIPHDAPLGALLTTWADAARDAAGDHAREVSHLGVAIPGPFDLAAGQSSMTHKFPALLDTPLRPLLRGALAHTFSPALPVLFGNDADLFALGEWWASPERAARLIGVTIGTGLGSGFIWQGQPQRSGPGVPPGGELWNVPAPRGTLEDWLCGAAVTRLGQTLTGQRSGAAQWAHAARQGNGAALTLWAEFGVHAADLLRPWVTSFGADEVVFGGNVSQAFDLFAPGLDLGPCRVRRSAHFELAPLLGAAALHTHPPETHA